MDVEQRARELLAAALGVRVDYLLEYGDIPNMASYAAALPAIISALAPQWQPIESAPKDGSEVLLWDGQGQAVCHWNETSRYWALIYTGWHAVDSQFDGATHWMPLPASPEVNNVHG